MQEAKPKAFNENILPDISTLFCPGYLDLSQQYTSNLFSKLVN